MNPFFKASPIVIAEESSEGSTFISSGSSGSFASTILCILSGIPIY